MIHMKMQLVPGLIAVTVALACSSPAGITDDAEEGFFPSEGVQLHYVIDFPAGPGPFPAVVFGHGSGEKTIGDYEGFAERSLSHGVAILRYDKRGVGKSGGTHVASSTAAVNQFIPVLAKDMAAAADLLARHPKVDADRIGLLGESQAGWVMPMAAVLAESVDFMIALSGPTLPLAQVGAFEALANGNASADLDALAYQVTGVEGGFDPRPWIRQLTIPALWVFGGKDVHVPARTCIDFLQMLRDDEGAAVSWIVYPDGDHGLRNAASASPIDYWSDVWPWFDLNS